jgi:hypothetical protein
MGSVRITALPVPSGTLPGYQIDQVNRDGTVVSTRVVPAPVRILYDADRG